MSSSLRSVQRTRGKALALKSPLVLPCPTCGSLAMKRVRGVCTLQDGTVVPDLERFQCSQCRANFFDDAAMHAIADFRKKAPHQKMRGISPRKRKSSTRTAA